MGFKCGIVGLPNVGKSTLFNALTSAGAAAENFPFCTIEPNAGLVPVPDPRLARLAELVQPQKTVAATMEFVDIAGLVPGASKGEGLGNQFLSHIRETDAIAQVVRCFDDAEVVHVGQRVDPVADMATINTELQLADLQTLDKAMGRISRIAKSGDKAAAAELALLEKMQAHINAGQPGASLALAKEEKQALAALHLLTMKPTLYIANVAEDGFAQNPYLDQVTAAAQAEGAETIALCNKLEAEIAELPADERRGFLAELGMAEPGLDQVIRAGYQLLGLITYFTAGPKEVRAWTLPKGSSAYDAAGVIHTDFQKGFIRAEVVAYDDYVACGSEAAAKDAGKWRLEGKDYRVQDADVMHFRFNV